MSRIGKQPVPVPSGVKLSHTRDAAGTRIQVEGPKGKLQSVFRGDVEIVVDGAKVNIKRFGDAPFQRAYHGTVRALVSNMVEGVSKGFQKTLEIEGVGYNAKLEGKSLVLEIGFCHKVPLPIPAGLTVETPKPTTVIIKGADKQMVGEFAAVVRRIRPPEPYKGKGIRYSDEKILRKAGKAFGSGE